MVTESFSNFEWCYLYIVFIHFELYNNLIKMINSNVFSKIDTKHCDNDEISLHWKWPKRKNLFETIYPYTGIYQLN